MAVLSEDAIPMVQVGQSSRLRVINETWTYEQGQQHSSVQVILVTGE